MPYLSEERPAFPSLQ